ncbi:MAG: exodeoxyribonuclease V subunit alpha [Proteobacteria bacterium]|nr:exodeoxyribonuclease V subunit alpha [Pseudomonadota bacterium]
MIDLTRSFLKGDHFESFVAHFANQMIRLDGKASDELLLASGLLCHEVFKGNVCIDLRKYSGKKSDLDFPDYKPVLEFPELGSWLAMIRKSSSVGKPGDGTPLILEEQDGDSILYTNRYWQYEEELARVINEKLRFGGDSGYASDDNPTVEKLFPEAPSTASSTQGNPQKSAAVTALRNPFTVITGGPGTGKTTIVVKILALILEDCQRKVPDQDYRFHLVAPTGKAASRLNESIMERKQELREGKLISNELCDRIKEEASTIHRLLGYIPESVYFRANKENPLAIDCLIVDEASMVDLALMSKLLSAIPPKAKIILLGDENQLASVEAGSVLTDICLGLRGNPHYQNNVVTLTRSHRFSPDQGIGKLSRVINEGKGQDSFKLLDQHSKPGAGIPNLKEGTTSWQQVPRPTGLAARMKDYYLYHYSKLLQASSVEAAFEIFEQFIILCALRKGPYGVEQINQLMEKIIADQNLIEKGQQWYQGKPVLIVSNDYGLNLFNGDIGITFTDPDTHDLRVFFKQDGTFRKISPYRLSSFETAFALTVHKSQGSEFDQVFLLLPPEDNKILTKELIYTGITRARKAVTIMGEKSVFMKAVNRSIERVSGLQAKLSSKI